MCLPVMPRYSVRGAIFRPCPTSSVHGCRLWATKPLWLCVSTDGNLRTFGLNSLRRHWARCTQSNDTTNDSIAESWAVDVSRLRDDDQSHSYARRRHWCFCHKRRNMASHHNHAIGSTSHVSGDDQERDKFEQDTRADIQRQLETRGKVQTKVSDCFPRTDKSVPPNLDPHCGHAPEEQPPNIRHHLRRWKHSLSKVYRRLQFRYEICYSKDIGNGLAVGTARDARRGCSLLLSR